MFARLLPIAALLLLYGVSALAAEKIATVSPSASHADSGEALAALCDGKQPGKSSDDSIPRFTFGDHKGTTEWVQLDFDAPLKVSSAEVYWFDDRPRGGCRVPQSWRLLYRAGYGWQPVDGASRFGLARNKYNEVKFVPVVTSSLRIEVKLQEDFSSGILEWRVNGKTHKLGALGPVGRQKEAIAEFDYPRTRLALATLVELLGEGDPQAKRALIELDEAAGSFLAARVRAGLGDESAIVRIGRAADQLAAIQQRYAPDAVSARVYDLNPDRCTALLAALDWIEQDAVRTRTVGFMPLATLAIADLAPSRAELAARHEEMLAAGVEPHDPCWMELYIDACQRRRAQRIEPHRQALQRIVFTKHHDIGGQHYAYTEDVSDSPYNDNNPFPPGGKLCLLELDGLYGTARTLLDEPQGIIRDPEVSYDGKRILFAWRKSMSEDDYHLYEMTIADGQVRQLTSGRGVADYEPAYLPDGGIVFSSTRCQQIIDCWWADVSNLFTCDADGRFLRRLSFDQAHTNYPKVLPDGRVIYTRWDYNDRGQLFPQPLFQMNPDGTGQSEFYGNNSWFPTTILHARGIPGTQKVVCVLSGHHTYQKGKLAIIDPSMGRQENAGVQLIAPVRQTDAVRIDKYGHTGEQFQYPFPLSETEFLVTFSTTGSEKGRGPAAKPFGVYLMSSDGRRELLAADPSISCSQAVPLAPRPRPQPHPSRVDYRRTTGTYFLQDVYHGPGLQGVARGTIKRLRVVALEFRAAGVGSGRNKGPAGGALVSTPVSINGAWDVKRVLGSTEVYADGSAAFVVPARTPVYFQALDQNNHVVQTMRSWSTLQPGETFSCVGCHDDKNAAPPSPSSSEGVFTEAMRIGPRPLEPFGDGSLGFSFARIVQPVLDQHCVECHNRQSIEENGVVISLEGTGTPDAKARKSFSDAYRALADPRLTSWTSPQSAPPMLPPYHAGAVRSPLIRILDEGHEGVKLSREEMDKIACWIDLAVPFSGDYTEAMDAEAEAAYRPYSEKRKRWQAQEAENIRALIGAKGQ